jgi:hypothetical protein
MHDVNTLIEFKGSDSVFLFPSITEKIMLMFGP